MGATAAVMAHAVVWADATTVIYVKTDQDRLAGAAVAHRSSGATARGPAAIGGNALSFVGSKWLRRGPFARRRDLCGDHIRVTDGGTANSLP